MRAGALASTEVTAHLVSACRFSPAVLLATGAFSDTSRTASGPTRAASPRGTRTPAKHAKGRLLAGLGLATK